MSTGVSVVPEAGAESPSGASTRGSHRLAAVAVCERQWALRYQWYFRQVDDSPWRLGGSLIHTTREYYYASLMAEPPAWFKTKSMHDRLREQAGSHPKAKELVQMALDNLQDYLQHPISDADNVRPLYIEEEFAATLGELDPGGPWPELDNDIVTCRPDLVYDNPSGLWVRDYKSHGRSKVNPRTGRLTRWKEDGEHALDWQVLVNMHIVRLKLGAHVRGFDIERTTRQPTWLGPYDFDVHTLTIPEMAYKETPRLVRVRVKQERDLMERLDRGEAPTASYHACMGRFGECDYRWACRSRDKEQMLERLRTGYTQPPEEEILEARRRLRVVQ